MKTKLQLLSCFLCVLVGITNTHGRDSVLNVIPNDALGFVVIHNLTDASRSVDDIAKMVQAPVPDLLNLAKQKLGLQKGLDEEGDAAIVVTSMDQQLHVIVLLPVTSFAEFLAPLNAVEPETGVFEVQIAGTPKFLVRKGDYVALAPTVDRAGLERFLDSTTSLAIDAQLAGWLDTNKASVVLTRRGVEQLLPKLVKGIRDTQDKIRAVVNGQAAAGLDLYVSLFTAAESEVEQFGLALRIDSSRTVNLMKRVQFKSGGDWAEWTANAKPADGDSLAGFPEDPFVFAMAGAFPSESMDELMKFSIKLMQDQPGFQLTPEQAQKYGEISTEMMRNVRAMRMVMGIPAPGTGLYGNTSAAMIVDDAQQYLERYEESLTAMSQLSQEAKSALIPAATCQHIPLDENQALEVTMSIPDLSALTPMGGPDMQMVMQHMFGAKDQLNVYVAAADQHTVLMSYVSLERLKAALDSYQSKRPGLSANTQVAKVAATLPPGSQFVAYISLKGLAEVVRQFASAVPGLRASAIPDFPDGPPVGIAAKFSPSVLESHLVVTAETLQAIGNTIAKIRVPAPDTQPTPP